MRVNSQSVDLSSPQTLRFVGAFSPIALRKAKIVCNFGLSECNRVNIDQCLLKLSSNIYAFLDCFTVKTFMFDPSLK